MIISGIILIPFLAARIFRAWLTTEREEKVQICPGCGLDRHDIDAIQIEFSFAEVSFILDPPGGKNCTI
jgi:hypothetical protein